MRACWYKAPTALYQQLLANELGMRPLQAHSQRARGVLNAQTTLITQRTAHNLRETFNGIELIEGLHHPLHVQHDILVDHNIAKTR